MSSSSLTLLTSNGKFKHKVSSVLNGLAEFASKHMFDDSSDTCWNSDQGLPQFVFIDFQKMVTVSSLQFTFQGGFVGQECIIEAGQSISELTTVKDIQYIGDSNEEHEFAIDSPYNEQNIRYLKITFHQSTDFYGRVTIYSLKVFGSVVEN